MIITPTLLGAFTFIAALHNHKRAPVSTAASTSHLHAFPSATHVQLQDEKQGQVLGRGANGLVRRATALNTQTPVAVKIVKRNSVRLRQEISILNKLMRFGGHANIVPFYGVADLPDLPEQCGLVFEIFPGGEVYESVIKRGLFTELEAKSIVQQIASALQFLHSHGIVHGDVKPENILCKTTHNRHNRHNVDFAICDFGSARQVDPATGKFTLQRGEPIGTVPYTAPEVLQLSYSASSTAEVTCVVDVFSLGVVLFVLLCGQLPFDDASCANSKKRQEEIARRILVGEYEFDPNNAAWRRVSDECKDLISQMLCSDPTKRITAEEILAHEWLLIK